MYSPVLFRGGCNRCLCCKEILKNSLLIRNLFLISHPKSTGNGETISVEKKQSRAIRMKNILVIGATGQIGSELMVNLCSLYGAEHVVGGYIAGVQIPDCLRDSGPMEVADVTDSRQIAAIVDRYHIDTIFNLAAILSAQAEKKPLLAWNIQINGVLNLLEISREKGCSLFTPSSIGAFGDSSPKIKTPQDTIQRPRTIYGVSKVSCELLSDYYYYKYGVDTRSVRFPGLISYVTPPGGGTTDYAVEIYYAAVAGEKFYTPVSAGTYMDMMYMPDALHAIVMLMEADPEKLIHRNSFNIASMSFDPEMIYAEIKKYYPGFEMEYRIDELRQKIADSWPDSLDDTCAREEWGWKPRYDLSSMTVDMIMHLKQKRHK